MQKAKLADKEHFVEIISNAFQDNLSANWVVKSDAYTSRRIKKLIAYAFDRSYRSGGAFLSSDKNGALLFLDPDGSIDRLKNTLDDIKLAFGAIGIERSLKVLKREHYVERFHPKEPFIYLWFIGVRKGNQGKGIGKNLLDDLCRNADERLLPIYLETSAPETLPYYRNAGFVEYHEWNDGFLGFPLWFLKRTAKES